MKSCREISKPLEVIDDLFAPYADSYNTGLAGTLPPREWREKAHFIRFLQLQDEDNFRHIPCLNDLNEEELESVAHQSLVRYRCMVQDVLEPEVFSSLLVQTDSYGKAKLLTTKYREICSAENVSDLGNQGLGTRGVYYCVPMPGESVWAHAPGRSSVLTAKSVEPETCERPPKQRRGAGGTKILCSDIDPCDQLAESAEPQALCSFKSSKFSAGFVSCVVKLYDADEEILRLCETVEILGVFCMDCNQPPADLCDEGDNLPRLHGLFVRKLPFFHPMLPFSPRWLSEGRLVCTVQRRFASSAIGKLRGLAIKSLQKCLAGDVLAAEYILALSVARVYGNNGNRSLGHWSLNISGWPEDLSVAALVEAISNLLPRVVHLPVTAQSLSTEQWKPRKDFEANRLQTGQLQLAPGTLLILDETNMEVGKLDEAGVKALRAIQALDSEQMLLIDFDRYEVQIPLEVNCLYVSNKSSMLKNADILLPLRPQLNNVDYPETSAGSLEALRFLLGLVSHRTQPLHLQQIMGAFSEDFAHMRDEFRDMHLGQHTLHVWVALARACCYTHGEEEMTLQRVADVALKVKYRRRSETRVQANGPQRVRFDAFRRTRSTIQEAISAKDKALLEKAYELREESRMEEENAQGDNAVAVLFRDASRQNRGFLVIGVAQDNGMRWSAPALLSSSAVFGPVLAELDSDLAIAYRTDDRGGDGVLLAARRDAENRIQLGPPRVFTHYQAQSMSLIALPQSRVVVLFAEHQPNKVAPGKWEHFGTSLLADILPDERLGGQMVPRVLGKYHFAQGAVSRISAAPLSSKLFAIAYRQGRSQNMEKVDDKSPSREASVSLVLALDRDTKRCHKPWPTKLECTLLRPSSGVRSWSSPPSRFLWSLEPAGHLGTSGDIWGHHDGGHSCHVEVQRL
ncbi:unnamed protein product [Cladocopium goreaui]|uniref:Mini-chromosome maintenance complex-binding protein (MCM-BP) (MCM-binding protein) n=1 Tax=Cladocopium goreaui TaxID=2562237 RepID=A0A9P1DHQ9_9DINO|nr:unnamed protein product [Cladocopium goreaui]